MAHDQVIKREDHCEPQCRGRLKIVAVPCIECSGHHSADSAIAYSIFYSTFLKIGSQSLFLVKVGSQIILFPVKVGSQILLFVVTMRSQIFYFLLKSQVSFLFLLTIGSQNFYFSLPWEVRFFYVSLRSEVRCFYFVSTSEGKFCISFKQTLLGRSGGACYRSGNFNFFTHDVRSQRRSIRVTFICEGLACAWTSELTHCCPHLQLHSCVSTTRRIPHAS